MPFVVYVYGRGSWLSLCCLVLKRQGKEDLFPHLSQSHRKNRKTEGCPTFLLLSSSEQEGKKGSNPRKRTVSSSIYPSSRTKRWWLDGNTRSHHSLSLSIQVLSQVTSSDCCPYKNHNQIFLNISNIQIFQIFLNFLINSPSYYVNSWRFFTKYIFRNVVHL